jgi:hypothetical protein
MKESKTRERDMLQNLRDMWMKGDCRVNFAMNFWRLWWLD